MNRLLSSRPACRLLLLASAFLCLGVASAQGPAPVRVLARDADRHGLLCEQGGKRILIVAGTPEQMGAAHGRLLREGVRALAKKALYAVGAGYSVAEGDWFFDRMEHIMARTVLHTPERFLRECDAMAQAAGLSQRDGRAANFFPELFHCSGVAVRGSASADGAVVHARVLDYMRDINLQKHALVQLWLPAGHHAWMSLGYAGFVGSVTCLNEKGLAIGEMGGRGEGNWDGMPMSFLLRDAMERAATVREALEIMRSTPRTCEYYYVLSDRTRDIAAVYATHETFRVLEAGEQHPDLPTVPRDAVMISGGSRAKLLSERLLQQHGKIDVPAMIGIIKRPVAMKSNLHNAIFQPETLDMWCADAGAHTPACDEPYVQVNLEALRRCFMEAFAILPQPPGPP